MGHSWAAAKQGPPLVSAMLKSDSTWIYEVVTTTLENDRHACKYLFIFCMGVIFPYCRTMAVIIMR